MPLAGRADRALTAFLAHMMIGACSILPGLSLMAARTAFLSVLIALACWIACPGVARRRRLPRSVARARVPATVRSTVLAWFGRGSLARCLSAPLAILHEGYGWRVGLIGFVCCRSR